MGQNTPKEMCSLTICCAQMFIFSYLTLSRRSSSDQPAQPLENLSLSLLRNPISLDRIVQSLQYTPGKTLVCIQQGVPHAEQFVASILSQSLT